MEVDFSVLNQKGNPAFYQDTFALRPAAGYSGRIFIATDTGNLYRDDGTTWTQIATGGGGGAVSVGVGLTGDGSIGNPLTSGIDTILAAAQLLTANRTINANSKNFTLSNAASLSLTGTNFSLTGSSTFNVQFGTLNFTSGGVNVWSTNSGGTALTWGNTSTNDKLTYNTTFAQLTLFKSGAIVGLDIDTQNNIFRYGRISGGTHNPTIIIEDSAGAGFRGIKSEVNGNSYGFYITNTNVLFGHYNNNQAVISIDTSNVSFKHTNSDGGLLLDYANNLWKFGDWNGFNSQTKAYLEIQNDTSGDWLKTYFGTNIKGLDFDFTNDLYKFGSFNGVGPTIIMDPTPYIELLVENPIRLNDNSTGVMFTTTAGTSAGYLIVNYNGTDYKIEIFDAA